MVSPQMIRLSAQRRRRRAIVAAAAVAVVVVWVVVSLTGSGGGRPSSGAPTPLASSSSYVAPQRWLALPVSGSTIDDIFPVNFPHSPEGAVAALVAKTETGWGLDSGRATRAAALYAAPWFRDQAQSKAAQLAAAFRQRLGLGPDDGTGQIPAGAYVHAQVVGAQWQVVDGNHVTVTVLVRLETGASADQAPQISLTSTIATETWRGDVRGGDWVYESVQARPASAATPGTAAFNSGGWTALQGRAQ